MLTQIKTKARTYVPLIVLLWTHIRHVLHRNEHNSCPLFVLINKSGSKSRSNRNPSEPTRPGTSCGSCKSESRSTRIGAETNPIPGDFRVAIQSSSSSFILLIILAHEWPWPRCMAGYWNWNSGHKSKTELGYLLFEKSMCKFTDQSNSNGNNRFHFLFSLLSAVFGSVIYWFQNFGVRSFHSIIKFLAVSYYHPNDFNFKVKSIFKFLIIFSDDISDISHNNYTDLLITPLLLKSSLNLVAAKNVE